MNKISYTRQGDYLLPDLELPEQENVFIGRYGRLHKEYLRKHKNGIYAGLLLSGKLNSYLAKIDIQAHDMLELLTKQMAEKQGINEQLKSNDQMAWVGVMNCIKACAEEIVFKEIVYS